MTKVRKTTMLIVSVILVMATFLAGCSSNNNKNEPSPSPSGEATNTPSNENPSEAPSDVWEFGSEPLEFTMYGHYSWYDVPAWDSTVAGRWLKENKQLNVVPVSAGGNHEQKLSTMIASQALPDVMWMDPF